MALFVVTAFDRPGNLAVRMATREAHFAWVARLCGQVRLGGPFLNEAGDMAGSLMILEAADLETANSLAAEDPYRLAGLFETIEIRPWRITLGAIA